MVDQFGKVTAYSIHVFSISHKSVNSIVINKIYCFESLTYEAFSVSCQLPCLNHSNHCLCLSTEIRDLGDPSFCSLCYFLSSYSAAALIMDIVLTVLIVNRM